jgi:hypothetical protein
LLDIITTCAGLLSYRSTKYHTHKPSSSVGPEYSPVGPEAVTAKDGDKIKDLKMTYLPLALAVLSAGVATGAYSDGGSHKPTRNPEIPAQAQFIDQKAFNVLPSVLPPSEFNGTSVSKPVLSETLV